MFRDKLSFAALFVVVAAGCTTQQPPRSFVQPNVIKKSDIDGTWYYLQTVTDAPPTSSTAFIGQSSELMKIRFDVQENMLYARRSYERIQGSEDQYVQDPAKYEGVPLAAWKIEKQFDIIRDYNATTGEETNKIIESEERAWNDREYIRIDWSENQVTDYVGIGINFFFDGVKVQSSSYWESDPTKPDALHLERADENDTEYAVGEATYLDVTNKMVVDPDARTECFDEGNGTECVTYPACFFSYSTADCSSQVVKVRHSFAKLSPNHQYQPRNWDGRQMEMFGIWDVGLNRMTYNRQYGVTNTGIQRHAARFNLWKKSYQDDGKTPIPYDQRELRIIPYYAESSTGTFPPELFDTGKEIIRQWNAAVSTAVKDVTNGKLPAADQKIFVWCHNPVKLAADSMGDADDAACSAGLRPQLDAKGNVVKDDNGNPILAARQGDPRRSNIFWVNQEQDAGPLGYGPPLFDIETGETISGQAYIYGAGVDTYTARSRDLVLLVAGKLDTNSFVQGLNVKDWVSKNRAGTPNQGLLTNDAVEGMRTAMDFSWARGQAPEAPIDRSSPANFIASINARENAIYKGGIFGNNQANLGQINRDMLRDTDVEAKMVTSDVMAMGGNAPNTDWTSLDDAQKARVSPLRSQAVIQAINDRMDRMRALGVDFEDFADEGLAQRAVNLANDKSIPNMDPEAIRQKLRKDIFLAVTLHEVGHNMGLRHNFRASFDAINYFPQYWQARQAGLASAQRYTGIDPSTGAVMGQPYAGGAACTGAMKGKLRPRYIDCPGGATSVDEVQAGVREYQYSSIMDYGAEFNSDLMGLGHYDKAAMKFSYAGDGYVEVFQNLKDDQTQQERFASVQFFSNSFGMPSPLSLFDDPKNPGLHSVDYYSFPDMFNGGIADIEARVDVPYSSIQEQLPVSQRASVQDFIRQDDQGRAMVPYFFCSDEFVGNLTCQRFDSGADAYEQGADLISRYYNFYLLNNFKRDRLTFHTSATYNSRIASRYFDILRQQLTWYALLRSDFEDAAYDTPQGLANFFADEQGWGNFTAAVSAGFDLLGKVITQPDAGQFTLVSKDKSTDYSFDYYKQTSDNLDSANGKQVVGLLDGKYSQTTWDFDNCGYYWADECQTRIGYFIDKTVAIDVLSQSQAYFTGRDTSTDVRKYAIGYYLPFKHQMQEKLGALLSGDYQSLAPTFSSDFKSVVNPGWTNNNANMTMAKPGMIDPAGGFTLQLYAGVYGLSEFPTTFDHDFIDTTRIFLLGNGESPIPEDKLLADSTNDPTQVVAVKAGGKNWFTWSDPATGKTYAAHSTPMVGDGTSVGAYRNDTGVRMLTTMANLSATATAACGGTDPNVCSVKQNAVSKYQENLDIMRSLHRRFGYGTYK
jgi:hypothetical protein